MRPSHNPASEIPIAHFLTVRDLDHPEIRERWSEVWGHQAGDDLASRGRGNDVAGVLVMDERTQTGS